MMVSFLNCDAKQAAALVTVLHGRIHMPQYCMERCLARARQEKSVVDLAAGLNKTSPPTRHEEACGERFLSCCTCSPAGTFQKLRPRFVSMHMPQYCMERFLPRKCSTAWSVSCPENAGNFSCPENAGNFLCRCTCSLTGSSPEVSGV